MAQTIYFYTPNKVYTDPPPPEEIKYKGKIYVRKTRTRKKYAGEETVDEIIGYDYKWKPTWGRKGTGGVGKWIKEKIPITRKVTKAKYNTVNEYFYVPVVAYVGIELEDAVESARVVGQAAHSDYKTSSSGSSVAAVDNNGEVQAVNGGDPLNLAENDTQKTTTGGNPLNNPVTESSSENLSILTKGSDSGKQRTLSFESGIDSNVVFKVKGGDESSIALSVYYAD